MVASSRTWGPVVSRRGLAQVYWLGGTPCAGKTTVAEILADQFGLAIYHTDRWRPHLELADPQRHPAMTYAKALLASQAERDRYANQPVEQQLAQLFALKRENFEFLMADLEAAAAQGPVICEGVHLPPDMVGQIATPEHVAYLISTRQFIEERNFDREREHGRVTRWPGHLERILRQRDRLHRLVTDSGARMLQVDGSRTAADTAAAVADHYGLKSGYG